MAKKPGQPWTPLLVDPRGRYRLPRKYVQSTPGKTSSRVTLPPEKCSNFKASDSEMRLPSARPDGDRILRMYCTSTPQLRANSRLPSADNPEKYDLSSSMPGLLPAGNQKASPVLIPKGNLPFGNARYDAGMDSKVFEIRRNRLRLLVDQLGTGGQTKAASMISGIRGTDVTPSYVNRMLMEPKKTGRKRIATDMARDIEKAFGKAKGWMDNDPQDAERVASEVSSQEAWRFSLAPHTFLQLDPATFAEIDQKLTQMVVDALMQKGKRA